MNTTNTLKSGLIAAALLVSATAYAHEGFEHPAVIVKQAQATKGYDYAAQFYGHPAGLTLSAEAPRTMNDHPAVTIAKRAKQAQSYDYTAQFYAHPAGLTLLTQAPIESTTLLAAAR